MKFVSILTIAVYLTLSNSASAKNWYVSDWHGGKSEGHCLIATNDERRGKSMMFGFSDGRFSFNENTFNPSSSVVVENIIPPVNKTTYFELTVVFNNSIRFDTIVRSSIVEGTAELSSTSIHRNKVTDYFQGDELDHELLVTMMKKSDTMTLINENNETIARFSLKGFTKIFSKYIECVQSLQP